MKLNNKTVYITIGILLALAILFAGLNVKTHQNAPEAESIKVVVDGTQAGELPIAEIMKLPAVKKRVTIRSSSEGVGTHVFTGTPLRKVLEAASPDIRLEGKKVTVKGQDSFNVVFTDKEIMSGENVLIVYAQDDQPLGSKAKGGTGPFRIIIPGDQFGLRAVKYVNELEVN